MCALWAVWGFLALLQYTQGDLCAKCTCIGNSGIVNCERRGLTELPKIEGYDLPSLIRRGVISMVQNPDLFVNDTELVMRYFEHFTSLEFDEGSSACDEFLRLKTGEEIAIRGCDVRAKQTTTDSGYSSDAQGATTDHDSVGNSGTPTTPVGNSKNPQTEHTRVKEGGDDLKKNWLLNTILGWVGVLVGGIGSSCLIGCVVKRGNRDIIQAVLRHTHGHEVTEFGINFQGGRRRRGRADRRGRRGEEDIPMRDMETDEDDGDDEQAGGGDGNNNQGSVNFNAVAGSRMDTSNADTDDIDDIMQFRDDYPPTLPTVSHTTRHSNPTALDRSTGRTHNTEDSRRSSQQCSSRGDRYAADASTMREPGSTPSRTRTQRAEAPPCPPARFGGTPVRGLYSVSLVVS